MVATKIASPDAAAWRRFGRRLLGGLAVGAMLALADPAGAASLAELAPAGGATTGGAFGTTEFVAGSFDGLPQWKRVRDDGLARRKEFAGCQAASSTCPSATSRTWGDIVGQVRGLAPMDQIKFVNSYFNRWAYITDQANYGTPEYWATVEEFLARSGDCEDYAISKFFALRELGYKNEDLRVFAVLDTIRNLGHAILVVKLDGKNYVLDIYNAIVTTDTFYKHYMPKYSVDEKNRYLHVPNS